jgi:PAS domain S-box-containing protein
MNEQSNNIQPKDDSLDDLNLNTMLDIISKSPCLIYIYDLLENRNVFANQEILSYLGFTVKEIQSMGGEIFAKLLYPDDFAVVEKQHESILNSKDNDIFELEYRMKNSKGDWIWLFSRESVFKRDKTGKPIQKIGIAIDITNRKQFEEKAKLQSKTLDAINSIFLEAMLADSEEALVKKCLDICQDLTGSDFGFLGEMNPNGNFDTIALNDPGWDQCKINQSEATKLIKNMIVRGLWGEVIKHGKAYFTNDPINHPSSVGIPKGHPPLTAFLGVPLKDKDRTIGMVALGNKKSGYNHLDIEVIENLSVAIVESLKKIRADITIKQQANEILEVSTPTIKIWDNIIAMPLIGSLDSERTKQFMERLLNGIIETNSEIALIDITGVPMIDTQTAHHLIDSITAAKLLGAKVILTGVKPIIAQTLVQLGIDLGSFKTQSSLAAGLQIAFKKSGWQVVPIPENEKETDNE